MHPTANVKNVPRSYLASIKMAFMSGSGHIDYVFSNYLPNRTKTCMQIQCEMNTKCMSISILCRRYWELLKLKHKTVAVEICSVKLTFHEVTSC